PLIAPQSSPIRNAVGKLPVFARDNYIQFFPKEHIYMYDGREQFTPVSSVISCFFEPFDAFSLSAREANKRHVSQGQVLEEWDAKGACSREVGTFMHQQIENYYNGGEYRQEVVFTYRGKYVQDWQHIKLVHEYKQFDAFLRDHDFKPFRTEWTIYDEQLKIAGTIDMIHRRGDIFDIYDWKRSAKIIDDYFKPIIKNAYGKKGLMGLGNIDDTPYWHYCIQQNLYSYMLERHYGIKVGKMYLVVFCKDCDRYSELEVPKLDEAIASIVKAWPTKRLQW
ncbi:MAG: PD-(D/E)XK nuclease family protein, partial [Bacteroidales bacterium]|nr:PD-(D/E)XK nuclease family protein [Bacteroidales bacterium]